MIAIINSFSNVVLLIVCLWAVLDKRVQTHSVGTLGLSAVGIFAFIRAINYGSGELADVFEAILNLSIALVAVWFYCLWMKKCKGCRRWRIFP